MSATSEICPASLGELSTLNTGIGREMLWVLIPFVRTKSLSMKLPVAPESKSALTECTSLVSVVPISIGRMIDVPRVSRVLVESRLGSLFSHLGLRGRGILTGGEREIGGASIGSRISILTSSTSNTANLLASSDRGALFASRVKQNPPPGRSQLPLLLLHLSRPSNLQSILPVAPQLISGHLDGGNSPLRDDWALRIDNILTEVQGASSGWCPRP